MSNHSVNIGSLGEGYFSNAWLFFLILSAESDFLVFKVVSILGKTLMGVSTLA